MADSYINPVYPQSYIAPIGSSPMGTSSLLSGALSSANQANGSSYIQPIQQATTANGQIDYPKLQRILGYTNAQMDAFTQSGAIQQAQQQSSIPNYLTGSTVQPMGGLSTYTSPDSSASVNNTTTSGGSSGFPIAGGAYDASVAARNAGVNPTISSGGGSSSFGGSSSGGVLGGGGASPSGTYSSALSSLVPAQTNSPLPDVNPGYTSGINSPGVTYNAPQGQTPQPSGGALQMQQANPQNALAQFQNTPGYQLLGNNQTSQYTQSPGYQYAVNQALQQVQGNNAARGLLESGRGLRDVTDRAQGMALQDYGNWWNRQNQLYSDYQNRLAGLAGGDVGANNAMTLGQNQANGAMQTGGDLGTLFGNQGTSGLGAIANTGAAQANTMQLAGNAQTQINANNQATQLAGATSGVF